MNGIQKPVQHSLQLALLAIAFWGISVHAQDSNPSLSALPRWTSNSDSNEIIALTQIQPNALLKEWTLVQGYRFNDRFNDQVTTHSDARYQDALTLIDRVIYPKVLSLFPDLKSPPRITVLFDEGPEGEHPGFVSRRYPIEKGVYAMVIHSSLARSESSSALSLVVAHEIQHILNYFFTLQRGGTTFTEDWLNEGLSKFMEYYVTSSVPGQELGAFFLSSRSVGGAPMNYANSFLWVSYLYGHFGGDKILARLIREGDRIQGLSGLSAFLAEKNGIDFNIPAGYLKPSSLLANFSIALGVNARFISPFALLSLNGGEAPIPELSNFWMRPELIQINPPDRAIDLKAGEARYLLPIEKSTCFQFSSNQNVAVYGIAKLGRKVHLIPLPGCLPEGNEWDRSIVLINYSDESASVKMSAFTASPSDSRASHPAN